MYDRIDTISDLSIGDPDLGHCSCHKNGSVANRRLDGRRSSAVSGRVCTVM